MVLGTGGERHKDALLGRGAYLRQQKRCLGASQFLLATEQACTCVFLSIHMDE